MSARKKQCDPNRPDTLCFRMESGSIALRSNSPEISLVRNGKRSYLWTGNDGRADGVLVDGHCFATLAGAANLRALARAILEEVGE